MPNTISKPWYKYTCTSIEEACDVLMTLIDLNWVVQPTYRPTPTEILHIVIKGLHPASKAEFIRILMNGKYGNQIVDLIGNVRINEWDPKMYFEMSQDFSNHSKFYVTLNFDKLHADTPVSKIFEKLPKTGTCICIIKAELSMDEYLAKEREYDEVGDSSYEWST